MRGKLRAGLVPREKDWLDVARTLFLSNEDEATIMKMTPKQRKAAQAEGQRARSQPDYRSWGTESSAEYRVWADSNSAVGWYAHLRAIGRPDLGRDLVRAVDGQPAYTCGRCRAWCAMPYAIPNEPRWVCESCAKGRGQPGTYRDRPGTH